MYLARLKPSRMVSLNFIWSQPRPGEITCSWYGTCCAVEGGRRRKLHHLTGKKSIRIDTGRSPRLVQADGEVIGHTPVEIQMVSKALHVIMVAPKVPEAAA